MKKILFLLLACISVLTINQTVNAAVNSDTQKTAGYISLNGSETKEVEPNMAAITFAVENNANTAQAATEENNVISNNIITALKLIIDANTDTIKTTNFSVRPNYTTIAGKRTIRNYSAVNSVTVTTKDITKVAKLIDTAIANGANRTNNLQFGIENPQQTCNELYPQVVKSLKSQATTLANALGTSLDGLKYMNVSCNADTVANNGRFYMNKVAMDSAVGEAAPSAPVESGKAKIRVFVNADFYVK